VTSESVELLHVDEVVVVVNKPASIPVHPTGRYRHNTVLFILAKEYGLKNLYPVHRLDKLTSGLLLFARNPQRAEKIAAEIRTHTSVRKTYLARVVGEFPAAKVVCAEPILVAIDIGSRELNKVHPQGKPSETHFKRLFYDGTHSVVKCKPKTGRTHQIRVHLQHLGHPIVNDPLYNPEYRKNHAEPWEIAMAATGEGEEEEEDGSGGVAGAAGAADGAADGRERGAHEGPERGELRAASTITSNATSNTTSNATSNATSTSNPNSTSASKSATPLVAQTPRLSTTPNPTTHSNPTHSNPTHSNPTHSNPQQHQPTIHHSFATPSPSSTNHDDESLSLSNRAKVDIELVDPQPLCHLCPIVWRRPKPHQLCIFLHALSYRSDTFDYETSVPDWALTSFSPTEYEASIQKKTSEERSAPSSSSQEHGYTWNNTIREFEDAHHPHPVATTSANTETRRRMD